MERYAEVLVRGKKTEKIVGKARLFLGLGIVLAAFILVLTVFVMRLFPSGAGWTVLPFTLFLLLLVAWGVLCAEERLHLEYEYTIHDGGITVDVIRGKKRRQQVVTLSVSQITAFGQGEEVPSGVIPLDVTGTPVRCGVWFLDYMGKEGRTRLLFCPNDAGLAILERTLRLVRVREVGK